MNARMNQGIALQRGRWTSRIRHRLIAGPRRRAALGLIAALVVLATGSSLRAEDELSTPTGWWWLSNASVDDIRDKIGEGFRLIDLEVKSTGPHRFAAVFVKNSGEYQKTWWWYFGVSSDFVSDKLDEHNARLIDLQIYRRNGEKTYAVVMIKNTGDDAAAWWYYSDVTFDFIMDKVDQHNARLIDLDTYLVGGQRRFSGVMIRNTGDHARTWWVYSNVTAATVADKLQQNKARLIDLEDRGGGEFTVLMQRNNGTAWWWYYGATESFINARKDQHGARFIDVEPYQVNGQLRYMVAMIDNSNELTSEVRGLMAGKRSGGAYGFRLEKVEGGTLASLQPDYVYYPASSIKVMQHLHAMRKVERDDDISLNTFLNVYLEGSESCNDDHGGDTFSRERLRDVLRSMMENSNNDRTNAVQEFFGRFRINQTAHNVVGMSDDSHIYNKFGAPCGGPSQDPPNKLTLRDINKLYEKVAAGDIFDEESTRDTFYSLMLDGLWIEDLIDEEAPGDLAPIDLAAFKAQVRNARKGGSWTTGGGIKYRATAGWVSLPTPDTGCGARNRQYLVSAFIDEAESIEDGFGTKTVVEELLRDEVRKALEAWRDASSCPTDITCDGVTDFDDLIRVLAAFGDRGGPEDIDGSGTVDFEDLVRVLAAWGPCP